MYITLNLIGFVQEEIIIIDRLCIRLSRFYILLMIIKKI